MSTKTVEFAGSAGNRLSARLELPPGGAPEGVALFAHCFTCSKQLRAVVTISRALARSGLAVLRFDFTGLGESEGDFGETGFSSNVEDLVAACRFLTETLAPPSVLVGHSLGGAAVLHAAARLPEVQAVATIGAPADPSHVLHLIEGDRDQIRQEGSAEVTIAGRSFRIGRQFLDDLEEASMRSVVSGLDKALLFFHSPVDQVVGVENAAKLYGTARHPKSFISLDTADHLLTDDRDATYVAQVLGAWVGRYLPPVAEEEDRGPGVQATLGAQGYSTDLRARTHGWIADEPVGAGGDDLGPSPYEHLLAALGSCTAMTLRMYADRKGWPLEAVEVDLRHSRRHTRDMADCDDCDRRADVIDRTLKLKGDLDSDQQARLMEIADRCPVHRTLDAGVSIRTTQSEA